MTEAPKITMTAEQWEALKDYIQSVAHDHAYREAGRAVHQQRSGGDQQPGEFEEYAVLNAFGIDPEK